MKRSGLLTALAAFVVAILAPGAAFASSLSSPRTQAIDPAMIDGLTEAINNRLPDVIVASFVSGGTVTFDNSAFKVPDETISIEECAARQRPNNPDVPADLRMQVAPGSVKITEKGASWTWQLTAQYLRDMKIDHIDFTVQATTEAGKFKALIIAPTPRTVAAVPYSPSVGGPAGEDQGVTRPSATVQFGATGGSAVSGTATLTKAENGTHVSLNLSGLAAGSPAQASIHAGTCSTPSASFASLPQLTVGSDGKATAAGPVLFRGTDPVAIETLADGNHVIIVSQGSSQVACAEIAAMSFATGGSPVGMPRTGGADLWLAAVCLTLLGVAAISSGLALRRQH